MNKRSIFKVGSMLALALLLCGVGLAQTESGKPGEAIKATPLGTTKVVKAQPDGDQPVILPSSNAQRPAKLDVDQETVPTGSNVVLWEHLSALSSMDQNNANIVFETSSDLSAKAKAELKVIENLWNSGNFNAAIKGLRALEPSIGDQLALGIGWKEPKSIMSLDWGTDVMVESRGSTQETCIDFHPGTENTFAVVRRIDPAASWTVNLSTDGGMSWAETFYYVGSVDVVDTDANVVQDYLYVGYVYTPDTEARMRRFSALDGMVDPGYFYVTVFDLGVTINEISITTNIDSWDNRVYYWTILADGTLTYHWSTQDGATWNASSTGVTDASSGLDACWNEGYTSGTTAFHVLSYINTSGRMVIAENGGAWNYHDLDTGTGLTAIGAYYDNFFCAFDHNDGTSNVIKYTISYDGGVSWFFGFVSSTGGPTSFFRPDVTSRRGGGISVVYQEEIGEPDDMWYRRRDYATANWSTPESFNEMDVVTGTDTSIEWLPGGGAEPYGMIWLSGSPWTAYFDRKDSMGASLVNDVSTISQSVGGVVNFDLHAGAANGNRNYLLLASITGTAPGTPLPGGMVVLPLNWDVFTNLVIDLVNTPVFTNFLGQVGPMGNGTAKFDTLGPFTGAAGLTIYFAYAMNGPWDFVSNPVSVDIIQ